MAKVDNVHCHLALRLKWAYTLCISYKYNTM
jgi:hypothetical protein